MQEFEDEKSVRAESTVEIEELPGLRMAPRSLQVEDIAMEEDDGMCEAMDL